MFGRRSIALIFASSAVLVGVGVYLFGSEDLPPQPDAGTPAPLRRTFPAPLVMPVLPSPRPAAVDASLPPDAQSPEEAAGPERKAPSDLAERFTEPQVRAAVTAALKEAGARGAGITNVDCTEYPCIIYVENVSPYDSKKIVQAPSLAQYRKESGFTGCFPTARTDGTGVGVCGFSYEPKIDSDQARDVAMKRLRYRVEQMRDATK